MKCFMKYLFISTGTLIGLMVLFCNQEGDRMTKEFQSFLASYEAEVIPLTREVNLAYFKATTSGKDELYQKMEDLSIKLNKIYANKDEFLKLKEFRESGDITDPILKRQLDLIYNSYLGNQIDESKLEKMIQLQTKIEKKFSTYRTRLQGKSYTDNEVDQILKTNKNSAFLEDIWKASKEIGGVVAGDVLQLVHMRNEAARELGFSNFHAMQLQLNEQNPQQIEQLFNELDRLTGEAFQELKGEMDEVLSTTYGIDRGQLMPWHYQNRFFQEAPQIYRVDMDQFYQDKDIVEITRNFYDMIGLPVDDLIEKSDLYEREGKYQHAYCTDIDREGDVRVVCNIKPNYRWMGTTLHEYGHAVYDKFNDRELPWTLRGPAHTFTTEAIAMLFESFASKPAWLNEIVQVPVNEIGDIAEECYKSKRLETLVFSRWAQVMYRFEKMMYENPDQNLNRLWWNLVEKYQLLQRPAGRDKPDWASKIHVALYPAYYHNYLMGNLLAAQLYYHMVNTIIKSAEIYNQSFAGQEELGRYLIDRVFKPGKKYQWNDMIRRATGEPLTAKYYALLYVQ